MCGRYVSVARRADLEERYEAPGPGDDKELTPSWNVAPTSKVYAVVERRRDDGAGAVREVRAVRWGLVPAWWKPGIDPKTNKAKTMPSLHNARADRVATAPSWRARSPGAGRSSPPPATTSGWPARTPTVSHSSSRTTCELTAPSCPDRLVMWRLGGWTSFGSGCWTAGWIWRGWERLSAARGRFPRSSLLGLGAERRGRGSVSEGSGAWRLSR